MKTQGNLYRIKQNKLTVWREWRSLLLALHKEEALETLKEEKIFMSCTYYSNSVMNTM